MSKKTIALAAALMGMAQQANADTLSRTLTRTHDPVMRGFRPKKLLVSQPTRNQRKIRKARRQREAAGDRRAFA